MATSIAAGAIQLREGDVVATLPPPWDPVLFILDPQTGEERARYGLPDPCRGAGVLAAAIDAERDVLISCGTLILRLDPATAETSPIVSDLSDWAFDIEVAPRGTVFVATDRALLGLDPSSGNVTYELPSALDVAIARDGALLVSRGTEGVWRIDPQTGEERLLRGGWSHHELVLPPGGDLFVRVWDGFLDLLSLVRLDPVTGAQGDYFRVRLVDANYVRRLVAEPAGSLLIPQVFCSRGECYAVTSRLDPMTHAWLDVAPALEWSEVLAVVRAPCDDGLDNDGDGYTDYPSDPGCRYATSTLERTQCQDGLNNDYSTGVDFDGGASVNGGVPISTADPQCVGRPWRNTEASGAACGLGFEVSLALLPLALARRRRERSRDALRL